MKVWRLRLYPRWFEAITSGKKTVEGRVWSPSPEYDYATMRPGDKIVFTNTENGAEIGVAIKRVAHYDNIAEYLRAEGLENCLPGVSSIKEGVNIYHDLAPNYRERAKRGGVYAVEIVLV